MRLNIAAFFVVIAPLLCVSHALVAQQEHNGNGKLVERKGSSGASEAHLRHRRAILSHENNHSPLDRRQDKIHGSTEDSAAKVENPTQECTPYGLTATTQMAGDFPTIWKVADILPNDDRATSILRQINESGLIPADIKPRGDGSENAKLTGAGAENGYNGQADADCYWTATGCVTPKHKGLLPDISTCDEPHTWGYGFDDGPNCSHNAFYDFMRENNQKASLFYIGSNVMDWPLEAQRGIVDGHQICVHTWSHHYMTTLTTSEAFAELYYTLLAIKRVLGITVTCWRPPFGDVDDRIRGIAQGLGLRTYIWGSDTNDFNVEPGGPQPTATIQANYNSIIAKGSAPPAETGGIIVLTHELTNGTMQLAVNNYPKIKQVWENVVPVGACLNITKPYAEDITYPNYSEYLAGSTMAKGLPTGSVSIDVNAVVTPQGTLSGMGGLMATAPAGGPDNSNSGASPTPAADDSKGGNSSQQSSKDNKTSGAMQLSSALSTSLFAVILSALLGSMFMINRL